MDLHFKTWLEMRSRGYFDQLTKKYPNVPRYVAKDNWEVPDSNDRDSNDPNYSKDVSSSMLSGWEERNNKKWKLETINLHWNILSPNTQEIILKRKFGLINPFQVPADEERFKQQRKLNSKIAEGENEPIIMYYKNGIYDLLEGFHRTMTLLLSGGGDPKLVLEKMRNMTDEEIIELAQSFRPYKTKVWVGY